MDSYSEQNSSTWKTRTGDVPSLANRMLQSLFAGFSSRRSYDWNRATEDNYRSEDSFLYGHYTELRQRLDYSYHSYYSKSRQLLQDVIIDSMLLQQTTTDVHNNNNDNQDDQWIVFTAGVMGAGKTHSCRQLQEQGQLPISSDFIKVDPDELRSRLPEYATYVQQSPERAGALTQKEAGMLAELLTEVALKRGRNVLVDGSLCDAPWYMDYFQQLRRSYPKLNIGIIHVTAPVNVILERIRVSSSERWAFRPLML
jgi:predicted kinase